MPTLKEREFELWKRYKVGDQIAGQMLIKSLAPIINQQVSKFAGVTLPRVAIEMEAKKLMYQAFDTYDPSKAQLNTHVINYLKKLQRFVINYQNVGHIPEPRAMQIGRYNTIFENIESEKGREPTVEELADSMSWPMSEVEKLQIELRKDLSIEHGSSDEDDMGRFFEYMADPGGSEHFRVRQMLQFVYFDADPIDKKVMEYTFGMGGSPKLKARDIALRLRLSPQKVSRKQRAIAEKLKQVAG